MKNNGWRVEHRFRKTESEELLRIFPNINTVAGTRKVTKEIKDRKKFHFLYK